MIHVEKITEKELFRRFDSLPQKLQDALTSEAGLKIADKICDSNHILDAEKRDTIQQLIGLVMLGFVHYYDIAAEIAEYAELDKRIADQIAKELDVKLFNPIKADLENNYHPIVEEKAAVLPEKEKPPAVVEEIKPPPPIPVTPVAQTKEEPKAASAQGYGEPKPIDISKIFGAKLPEKTERAEGEIPTPGVPALGREKEAGASPPAPPAAKTLPSAPAPTAAPTPTPIKTAGPISEFERLKIESGKRPAISDKQPEAPAMLYKQSEAKPGEKAAGFKLEIPIPKFSTGDGKPAAPPPKPALFEFGLGEQPQPKPQPAPSAPRVVHYSDLRTPLSDTKNANATRISPPPINKPAERDIQEITAETKFGSVTAPPIGEKIQSAAIQPGKPPAPPPPTPPSAPPSGEASAGRARIEPPPVPPRSPQGH